MNRRSLIAIAAAAAALILLGVAVVSPRFSSPSPTPVPTAVPATPATGSLPQTGPVTYAVSADQAGVLAIAGAPGVTLTGTPAIVTYQGVVAYEVPLSNGLAYVDATSGTVLTAPGTAGATPVGGANGGGGGEGGGEGGEGSDNDD
jgi:hypothetical protein